MPLYHTEDQAMLADTARQFMAEEGSIAKQLRHWRDQGCKDGFGHALWKQFAELGLLGLPFAEADGGMGAGPVETMVVMTELGRALAPEPYLGGVLIPGGLIASLGSAGQRARLLPALSDGGGRNAGAVEQGHGVSLGEFGDIPMLSRLERQAGLKAQASQRRDGVNGINLYRANLLPHLRRPRPRHTIAPVQLVVARRDPFITAELYEGLEHWAPKLSRAEVDAGHWLPLTQPDWLAKQIAQFNRQLWSAT